MFPYRITEQTAAFKSYLYVKSAHFERLLLNLCCCSSRVFIYHLSFLLRCLLAVNYLHKPPITGASKAGGGWKHWLSKLVFKCILAGLHALHYLLPIQKNVALQSGVLQQADMRPVYREEQKCRAEYCGLCIYRHEYFPSLLVAL